MAELGVVERVPSRHNPNLNMLRLRNYTPSPCHRPLFTQWRSTTLSAYNYAGGNQIINNYNYYQSPYDNLPNQLISMRPFIEALVAILSTRFTGLTEDLLHIKEIYDADCDLPMPCIGKS
jgi:hypothetical protein